MPVKMARANASCRAAIVTRARRSWPCDFEDLRKCRKLRTRDQGMVKNVAAAKKEGGKG